MSRNHKNDYFAMLTEMIKCSYDAAEKLRYILHNFDVVKLETHLEQLHAIEHAGDDLKHNLVKNLVKEFITPIEREDIVDIAESIDNVTDVVENVLIKIHMYNILEIKPEALSFADIICEMCQKLVTIFEEFREFKKSQKIKPYVIDINKMEEQGDTLYMSSMRALYVNERDAIKVLSWTQIYDCLEKCCDICENTADSVENVMMKNL
jgi:predicted phosphate transport protein (TIGR00153 family)